MPYASQALQIGELRLPWTRIAVFVLALALTGLLHLFMSRSRSGNAIRAVAQNPRAAATLGIDVQRVRALAFGIGAALAGASGSLMAALYAFSPIAGDSFTMKSFVIVLLGGLGSMAGAIVAAIVLGGLREPGVGPRRAGPARRRQFLPAAGHSAAAPARAVRRPAHRGERVHADAGDLRRPARQAAQRRGCRLAAARRIALALLLVGAPFGLNAYWMRVLSAVFTIAVVAQGINLMAGYTGYPAFGNVVFFGVGAYATAILMGKAQLVVRTPPRRPRSLIAAAAGAGGRAAAAAAARSLFRDRDARAERGGSRSRRQFRRADRRRHGLVAAAARRRPAAQCDALLLSAAGGDAGGDLDDVRIRSPPARPGLPQRSATTKPRPRPAACTPRATRPWPG